MSFLNNLVKEFRLKNYDSCFLNLLSSKKWKSSLLASRKINFDPTSAFFLLHSDSSSLMLVSQQLTGDNYAFWSRVRMTALLVKNKLRFIDGYIAMSDDYDQSLLNSWIHNMVILRFETQYQKKFGQVYIL